MNTEKRGGRSPRLAGLAFLMLLVWVALACGRPSAPASAGQPVPQAGAGAKHSGPLPKGGAADRVAGEVLVTFAQGVSRERAREILDRLGRKLAAESLNIAPGEPAIAIKKFYESLSERSGTLFYLLATPLPDRLVSLLKQEPGVLAASLNYVRRID